MIVRIAGGGATVPSATNLFRCPHHKQARCFPVRQVVGFAVGVPNGLEDGPFAFPLRDSVRSKAGNSTLREQAASDVRVGVSDTRACWLHASSGVSVHASRFTCWLFTSIIATCHRNMDTPSPLRTAPVYQRGWMLNFQLIPTSGIVPVTRGHQFIRENGCLSPPHRGSYL